VILFAAPLNLNFKDPGTTEGFLLLVLLLVIMINVLLYFVYTVTKGNMANINVY